MLWFSRVTIRVDAAKLILSYSSLRELQIFLSQGSGTLKRDFLIGFSNRSPSTVSFNFQYLHRAYVSRLSHCHLTKCKVSAFYFGRTLSTAPLLYLLQFNVWSFWYLVSNANDYYLLVVCSDITEDDLIDSGVSNPQHCRVILEKVKELRLEPWIERNLLLRLALVCKVAQNYRGVRELRAKAWPRPFEDIKPCLRMCCSISGHDQR